MDLSFLLPLLLLLKKYLLLLAYIPPPQLLPFTYRINGTIYDCLKATT